MAGINLSQTLQEKQAKAKGSFFDTGFYINIGALCLTVACFFGVRWYLANLQDQVVSIQNDIATRTAQLEGNETQRVADFRERLDAIEKNLDLIPDSAKLFLELEGALLPNVRLTLYEEKWDMQQMTIGGVTDNIKYVAQTMLSLKRNSQTTKVAVKTLEYDKEGMLKFTLVATMDRAAQKK